MFFCLIIKTVCHGDDASNAGLFNEQARHYAFEIDEGAVALSDVLDNFRRDLVASLEPPPPVEAQKDCDAVMNALFLLNHRMRELDTAMTEVGHETSSNGEHATKINESKRILYSISMSLECVQYIHILPRRSNKTLTRAD